MEQLSNDILAQMMNDEAQKQMQNAKADEKVKPVEVPGIYRMRVGSKKFKNKNNEVIVTPNFFLSKDVNNLCVSVNLEVVDGTPNTPAGSYIIQNFVLAASEATNANPQRKASFATALNISKSKLSALLGKEVIKNAKFDMPWLVEYLSSEFDSDFNEIRRHKMVNEVMVKLDSEVYLNKETLKVTAIAVAKPGDRSIENPHHVQKSTVEAPVDPTMGDFTKVDPLNAADISDPSVERYE